MEFGLRISLETQKKIEAAIGDLGNASFPKRQAATSDLMALREKAYPALVEAAKGKDQEAVRRAEQLLDKIRAAVPEEVLEIPPYDVVHTADSKIAGRIKATSLKVSTLPFGEQQIKLTDIRALRSQTADPGEREVAKDVLQDPGTLGGFQAHIGKTLSFKVTGPPALPGFQLGVYGTDVYTLDSSLAGAAIHAGAVKTGQTAIVRVTILGPQAGFQPSMRNGVMSLPYGPWPGFRIEPTRGVRKN